MAYRHEVLPASPFSVVSFHGTVTGDDVVHAVNDLVADPTWFPGRDVIWDGRDIRELVVEITSIDKLAVLSRDMDLEFGAGKTAIIVARDLDYAIAALIGARRQSRRREFNIFRSPHDALAWLGVEDLPADSPWVQSIQKKK